MQNENPSPRRTTFRLPTLAVAITIAIIVRMEVSKNAEAIAPDGTIHLSMARELAGLSPMDAMRSYQYHPGYPAVLGAVAELTGAKWPDGWIAVARGVSIVMSLIALAALYYVALKIFNRSAALITVVLFGIAREFTSVSCDCLSDAQAIACALLTVAFSLYARENLSSRNTRAILAAAAAGLAAGLGYLTRPEILLCGAIAIIVLLCPKREAPRDRKIRFAAVAALVIVLLACVLPYAIHVGGLTQKKSIGDIVRMGAAAPLAAASLPADALNSMIRAWDRGRAALSTGMSILACVWFATFVGRFVLRINLPPSVLVMPTRPGWFILFVPVTVMVILMTTMGLRLGSHYASSRHMLMPAALGAPAAGAGLLILVEWTLLLADKLRLRRLPALATACWLAMFAVLMGARALPVLHEGKAFYRRAGETIARQLGPGRLVLAYDGRIPFFASSPAEQFHAASKVTYQIYRRNVQSPKDLLNLVDGAEKPYDVVAIDTRLIAEYNCDDLVEKLKKHDRFRLMTILHSTAGYARRNKVWLFRIIPPARSATSRPVDRL